MKPVIEFLKRNKPVFWVGVITTFLFLTIILLAETRPDDPAQVPGLNKITEEEEQRLFDVRVEETPQTVTQETTDQIRPFVETNYQQRQQQLAESKQARFDEIAKEQLETSTLSPTEVDANHGAVIITFSENGWQPNKSYVYLNQLVIWQNSSGNQVQLKSLDNGFKALEQPVIILPGESYQARVLDLGNWVFTDANSNKGGSMIVIRAYK